VAEACEQSPAGELDVGIDGACRLAVRRAVPRAPILAAPHRDREGAEVGGRSLAGRRGLQQILRFIDVNARVAVLEREVARLLVLGAAQTDAPSAEDCGEGRETCHPRGAAILAASRAACRARSVAAREVCI